MAAIISRTEIINDELSPTDDFAMAEAFGIKSKKKTKDEEYKFPMQIPCIAKMQVKDKSLMKKLMLAKEVEINPPPMGPRVNTYALVRIHAPRYVRQRMRATPG
jgi:hypothetical protein